MANAKEKFEQLKFWVRENPRHTFVIVLGLLFVVRLAVFLMTSSAGFLPDVRPNRVQLTPDITEESEVYQKVTEMLEAWPEFGQSEYALLTEFNIFDPQQVRNANEIQQEARRRYDEALAAFYQGDLNRAEQLVEQALRLQPSLMVGRELRDQIVAQRASQPAEGEGSPPAQ